MEKTVQACVLCGEDTPHVATKNRSRCLACRARHQQAKSEHDALYVHAHKLWTGIRYRAKQGFCAGEIEPSWSSLSGGFNAFLESLGLPPTTGHVVGRKDMTKGFTAENSAWIASKDRRHPWSRHSLYATASAKTDRYGSVPYFESTRAPVPAAPLLESNFTIKCGACENTGVVVHGGRAWRCACGRKPPKSFVAGAHVEELALPPRIDPYLASRKTEKRNAYEPRAHRVLRVALE